MDLNKLSDEEILQLRLCELPLSIKGTWVEECIDELYQELEGHGIIFKPSFYVADEWLTPDKEPVIGIPFFLTHPSLMKLEKKMMLDVEGGTKTWCMQLLRHETGHAINYAYKLYMRKKWQKIFGYISVEYEDTYRFRPYSKNFVRHLEDHYAQCHPDEDFAETFSVWLTPGSNWVEVYKGWKALDKLTYVDELMKSIKGKVPLLDKGKKYWEARKIRTKLINFYRKKRQYHAEEFPDFHDQLLIKIFIPLNESEYASYSPKKKRDIPFAASFLKKYRRQIVRNVARWTGEKKFIIDEFLKKVIMRCRMLNLVVSEEEAVAILQITTYITTSIMNSLYTGKYSGKSWAK